jgi:hypothetical protein
MMHAWGAVAAGEEVRRKMLPNSPIAGLYGTFGEGVKKIEQWEVEPKYAPTLCSTAFY